MSQRLFIVFLRRPAKDDPRTDPFWEFGSFGCTGCHKDNLLHPQKRHVSKGDRLAFIQGGKAGCKLLLITPPVKWIRYGTEATELRWANTAQPFRYWSARAPAIAKPGAKRVALAELGRLVNRANRSTAEAKLASRFRTHCQPLDPKAAAELVRTFERAWRAATKPDFIETYVDALPQCDSPVGLKERRRVYRRLLRELQQEAVVPGCCIKREGESSCP